MKNRISAVVALAASLGFFGVANASDGTIQFTGTILEEACTVDAGSANQTVNLGNVAKTAFTGVGSTAAPAKFSIKLSNCPADSTTANVRFDGTGSTNSDILALSSDQTAGGVGVAIYESDSATLIKLGTSSKDIPLSATGVTESQYVAKYYQDGPTVTAGTANSTASFTVTYP